MKAVQQKEDGFVEITLRASVYRHLHGILGRYVLGDESEEDALWLGRFLADLERRDAEDAGVN